MKLLIIKNPKSGSRQNEQFSATLDEKKHLYKWQVEVLELRGEGLKERVTTLIKKIKPDALIAAGGDGTVNFVAEMSLDHAIPFAIIPTGSANGMAHELLIPSVLSDALDVIQKGRLLPIDVLQINNRICIHLADVGVNARIVKNFQQDKKRGILTYAKYLLNELFLIKKYRFFIEYDGEQCVHKGVSLTFANSSKYGTGAIINPLGKIDDGLFELCLMKPFPRVQLLALTWKMFRGTLHTSEYFQIISCKKARIYTRKKTTLQIDGEVIGKVKEIELEILPRAVSVYVP